jgi:hypothetical protein
VPSSHLRCLSLQVKQPVRTRLLLAGAVVDVDISLPRTVALTDFGGLLVIGAGTGARFDSLRRFEDGT